MKLRAPILLWAVACVAFLGGCRQTPLGRLVAGATQPTETHLASSASVQVRAQDIAVDAPHQGFSSVISSDCPQRPITLVECIALALENGRLGDFFDSAGSNQKTSVTALSRQVAPSNVTDSIRVFAYDPAIAVADVEESLSRFDVWAETSLFWNRIHQPARFLNDPSSFEEFSNRNKVDDVDFQTGLYKRLATGGFAGLQFRTGFENNFLGPNSTISNPAYRPALELTFEQPLWQGAGVLINHLRDFHPASLRRTLPDAGQPPGILLTRLTHKQSQLEFERQVHELLYRVEEAYWKLHCAYWDLYSSDNGMKQAHAAWQIAKARFDAGGIGIEDLAMIEEQYHFFRTQRLQALGRGQAGRPGVLEAERRLRYIVGLCAEDGTRLIPVDQPVFAAYEPNLEASVVQARFDRPEFRILEQEIKAAALAITKAKDRLKPDLRFVSRYDVNGLGEDFGESLGNVYNHGRHEWELGLRLQFPLGFRAGHAAVQRAQMQHAQRMVFLKDQKQKLMFSLQRSFRDLVQYRKEYEIRSRQRHAAALQLRARHEKFKAGGDPTQPGSFIDLLLRAQRNWSDALREEYVALCSYRVAIADFERQKGTITKYANVTIQQGPLPLCAAPQASKFLHQQLHQPAAESPTPMPIMPAQPEQLPMPGPPSLLPPPNQVMEPSPGAVLGPPMSANPPMTELYDPSAGGENNSPAG